MKTLYEYIVEELEGKRLDNATKVLKLLNDNSANLETFVKELNAILKQADSNDNAKLWIAAIKDLFGGENGSQYKAANHKALKITELYPTQSEIDIMNSAKWITKDWGAKGVEDMFKNAPFGKTFPVPVLVYQSEGKNWIIDGHHRWSQVGLINRDASLDCLVVSGPEPVRDFLKITQGAIAAVLASENKNNGKKGDKQLPVGAANPENNIFGDALKGDKLKDQIVSLCKDNASNFKIVKDILNKHGKNIEKEEDLGELVMKNRDAMLEAKQNPPEWAEPRPQMPQTDAAGPNDPNDAKDGNPDNEGSALYAILHKSKFPDVGKK